MNDDSTAPHFETRNGRIYCTLHRTWWKACPCPGQVSTTVTIDKAAIEATTPKQGAYLDALRGVATGEEGT